MKKAWKSLRFINNRIVSDNGDCVWKIGDWKEEKDVRICNHGFHASKLIIDAMSYVGCEVIAEVEYDGEVISQDNKFVSEKMRIIKAYKWNKIDSMNLSIYSVKQAMKYIDKNKFPEVVKVCEDSINAINNVILNDTEETRKAAAWATRVARAAWAAAWAAWAAAWAARATRAAWAAWAAARAAAVAKKLQHKWLLKYIKKNCKQITR